MGRYSHRPTTLPIADGDRHALLVALHPVESTRQGRVWLWRCDCGREKALPIAKVIHGRNVSCGCRRGYGLHPRAKVPKPEKKHRVVYKERVLKAGPERWEVVVGDVVMAIAPTWEAAQRSAKTFNGTIRRSA